MQRLLLLGIFALSACAGSSHHTDSEHREGTRVESLPDFSSLDLSGTYSVEVVFGDTPQIELVGNDKAIRALEVSVDDGILRVENYRLRHSFRTTELHIVAPRLERMKASGSADVDIVGFHGESLALDLNGAGETTVSGQVEKLRVDMSGANELDTTALHATTVDLELNGAGSASVLASKTLDAEINGSGHVRYSGAPKTVRQEINGVGSVGPL